MRRFIFAFSLISVSCFSAPHLDFKLSDLNQQSFDSKQLDGKVVYLDFWASWCGPCRKSFPWMNKMQTKYGQDGFTVVAINLDDNPDLAKKFLVDTVARFKVLSDPSGGVAEQFDLIGMPTAYLFDRNGTLIKKHTGFFSNKTAEYEVEIQTLLKD